LDESVKKLTDELSSIEMLVDGAIARGHSRPDYGRAGRKGIPEVILATNKTTEQIVDLVDGFVSTVGRAIVSDIPAERAGELALRFPGASMECHELARMAVIHNESFRRPRTGGRVGIITAGTSDLPVAQQAAIIASEMGCQVKLVSDVGVAGIHRLVEPLSQLLDADVDVLVVAAGMDGALPSVVAGLVRLPVIGLPTSNGYGLGGKGHAALLSMLQTCSPGLVVVNIDNGVGAGASAALIANRVATTGRRNTS
jgi:NCAIR mutase (PurE)-related protein